MNNLYFVSIELYAIVSSALILVKSDLLNVDGAM